MPAPVINTTTSILGYRQGEAFIYQPAASNTPTSWAWTGLPPGVTANTTTGRITGPATAEGVFLASVTATNGDGTSAPLVVPIGIYERAGNDDGAVLIDIDVRTWRAYPHGVADWKPGDPVGFGKNGDTLLLDIGYTANGGQSLLMVNPTVLRVGLKEKEPEKVIDLSDGSFTTVGEWDRTRYRVVCPLDDAKVTRALRNYVSDDGTFFNALMEVELQQIVGGESLVRTSQTFKWLIERQFLTP